MPSFLSYSTSLVCKTSLTLLYPPSLLQLLPSGSHGKVFSSCLAPWLFKECPQVTSTSSATKEAWGTHTH